VPSLIEINLLPSGAGGARKPAAQAGRGLSLPVGGTDPRVIGLAAAALLVLVLGAFAFWRQGTQRGEIEAKVEHERQDSLRLARTIALMRTIDSRKDTIEQKMAVIRSVDGRRYVWPHLMDEISRAVPPFTWLTRVAAIAPPPAPPAARPAAAAPADTGKKAGADSTQGKLPPLPPPPPPPGFNVEGDAATTQALTRFMKNLEASPFIRDVALVTSEQTQTQGRTYLKFTLEARWEQPDSTLIETVPVVPVN
jgi:Tfp pilus assembly protein PilN